MTDGAWYAPNARKPPARQARAGELVIGKRFETRAQAVQWADLVRGDLEKGA